MKNPNPYAPPSAEASESPPRKKPRKKESAPKELPCWREGDCIVMNKEGTRLPERCIVCNSAIAGKRELHQLMWHPPWMYAFLVCGLLPYALLAVPARKGARVEFGLCGVHRDRRRNGLVLAWAGVALALLVLGLAGSSDSAPGVWIGLAMVVALPLAGTRMARVAHPVRIDDRLLWLRVGAPFLASIPERDD